MDDSSPEDVGSPPMDEVWAALPMSAQRLCLCESARQCGIPGYLRSVRQEIQPNGDVWAVVAEGSEIVLLRRAGEKARQDGIFEANRLRNRVAFLKQRQRIGEVSSELAETETALRQAEAAAAVPTQSEIRFPVGLMESPAWR